MPNKQYTLEFSHFNTVHGDATGGKRTPEYRSWEGMLGRCYNQHDPAYSRYGGRGIFVCDRWREAYSNFLADMGRKPSPKHSIDRFPDNNGPYSPENCRWATSLEQNRNKRNNRLLTSGGQTKTLSEWAGDAGVDDGMVARRLTLGDSLEKALEKPKPLGSWADKVAEVRLAKYGPSRRKNPNLVWFNGEGKNLYEWARIFHISPITLTSRIERGWPVEKALKHQVQIRTKA